jgi:nitronate monooxygenase
MGDISVPHLASAVANAGGLGMMQPNNDRDPKHIEKMFEEAHALTRKGKVLGMNFLVPVAASYYPDDLSSIYESVEMASKMGRVVEFFYRKPDPKVIEIVHEGGALAVWQVGSKDEAIEAVDAGCDIVVAQGVEAGGHVRGKVGLFTLLCEVLESIDKKIPVLAAGGIASGRKMAAALSAGASGVTMGTRFVVSEESRAHPEYIKALINSDPEDTEVTLAWSYGWSNAPHRVLRSSIEAVQLFKGDIVSRAKFYGLDGWYNLHKFEPAVLTRDFEGTLDAIPHFAGEGVADIHRVQPAAEIVNEISSEAEAILKKTHVYVESISS